MRIGRRLFGGWGTLYRATLTSDPLGTEVDVTYAFGFLDPLGASPEGGLALASDGNLCAAPTFGGRNNAGTVVRVGSNGLPTLLHTFNGTDGSSSYGTLLEGSDGLIYGTTAGGGIFGAGSVFRLSKDGAFFGTLHAFSGADGSGPNAGLWKRRTAVSTARPGTAATSTRSPASTPAAPCFACS